MHLDIAASTHIGRRSNNEDAYAFEPSLGLCVVADGMGGYEGGEIASRLAVAATVEFVRRNACGDNTVWPGVVDLQRSADENELAIATRVANASIEEQRHGRLAQMGTTFAALRLRDQHCVISHVGDARVYRIRAGLLETLTEDHSLYNELAKSGQPMPARGGYAFGNVVTRALGTPLGEPDVRVVEVTVDDVLILCTDGLWDPVPPSELFMACTHWPPALACERLVQSALDHGGKDNITVIIARVVR